MSKLANLLFVRELAGRIARSEAKVIAAAAHPGYASTELQAKGASMRGSKLGEQFFRLANRIFAQSAANGALPILYAATAEGVSQGAYYGPGGKLRLWGAPQLDQPSSKWIEDGVAEELWRISESLTGTEFAP